MIFLKTLDGNLFIICDITIEELNQITSNHIIKYLNDLKAGIGVRKNSLDSICTKKNVFSAFWNYMFLNKFVDDNIIRHIPGHLYKSEITQKEVKVPTDEQVQNFICRLNDGNNNEFNIIRNLAIVKLLMGSGIRSEELINLDVKDLCLDEEKPYIMILGKGKIEQYDKVFISLDAKRYLLNIFVITSLLTLLFSFDKKRALLLTLFSLTNISLFIK